MSKVESMSSQPPASEATAHGYVIRKPVPGSVIPADYTFVQTRDEIYVPISVRKPAGDGPFPAVTMGSGEGRRGMRHIESMTESLAGMQDRMIARGYAVVCVNYRNEIPHLYEQRDQGAHNLPDNVSGQQRILKSAPTLDHEDLIAIFQYLGTLPYVDEDRIGAMGVSHSGEMILKAAVECTFAAGVSIEPAAHEFLGVDMGPTVPRVGTEIQYQDIERVRKNANKEKAMERIARIRTPLFILGRDQDHLQGIFQLTYEWMSEAGKDVRWGSYEHPVHGYVLTYRQEDGSYQPDPIQEDVFEKVMRFFDGHLKRSWEMP